MAHIGFEMQNAEAGVAPAPNDFPHSPIKTSAPVSADNIKMTPIGFEGKDPLTSDGITLLGFEGHDNDATEAKVSLEHKENLKDGLFLDNGVDRIDYILAYEPGTGEEETLKKKRRDYFERELMNKGLKLEHEDKTKSKSGKVCFVKIHAPWEVLIQYAELMHMHMPLTKNDMKMEFTSCWPKCPTPFDLDKDIVKQDEDFFTAPFSRARMHHTPFRQGCIPEKPKFASRESAS